MLLRLLLLELDEHAMAYLHLKLDEDFLGEIGFADSRHPDNSNDMSFTVIALNIQFFFQLLEALLP